MTTSPPPHDPNEPQHSRPDLGPGGYPVHPGTAAESSAPQAPQPPAIQLAVKLMWAGAAVSLVSLVVGLATLGSLKDQIRDQLLENDPSTSQSTIDAAYGVSIAFVVVFGALGVLLWLWMAWKNGAGRKWARIVATVFAALNVLSTLFTIVGGNTTTLSAVFTIINVVLAIVILVLLWRKESSDFYAARSAPQFG